MIAAIIIIIMIIIIGQEPINTWSPGDTAWLSDCSSLPFWLSVQP